MKISLKWLNDYIESGLGAQAIAEILSNSGFPCEGIEHLDGDSVIDVEVTSNRGDCLSYLGVARELSAATGKELKFPVVELDEFDKNVSEFCSVEIAEPDLCGRYTARVIDGIKVGPSPDWMVKRLEAAGMRSVNNVVDATNYAMLETGQPPRAFDYSTLKGGKIIVRKAKAGERIVSIDGTKCDLNPNMLIIADAAMPVAVAGVMGGLETEVSDKTTTVLLEDASFNPVSIRTTSRRLALPSEASYRFERIVDIERIDWASRRTAQLIVQVAGGRIAKGVVDVYPRKWQQKEVLLRIDRLNKLLGMEVPVEQILVILGRLHFQPKQDGGTVKCLVPSWRSDVYREADLIEEVARVYGYDKVPVGHKIEIEVVPADKRQKLLGQAGGYLNACGFYETVNITFVDDSTAEFFAQDSSRGLAVKDVSRKSTNLLRQSLIGSLLGVLKTNLYAKNTPCRIFETAATFVPTAKAGDLPYERIKLGLVSDGDMQDIRGVVEYVIRNTARNSEVTFVPAALKWAEVGAEIFVNGRKTGVAGVVSKDVRDKFDFKEVSPVAAEIDFELLLSLSGGDIKIKPIPKFPAIKRDLSILVDEAVTWDEIARAVNEKSPEELEDIHFVGIYRGKGIPAGKKSLTLSLCFRDDDGTLTHEKVDGFQQPIVASLSKAAGAELRTV
ncbi:MAG: phenylalanine--tRNA ligase subunit beta [Candidatus Brocadiia bacterium]|nr:MAG: phenylalanine--tRNA ligase subunit beta [Candidatus Brocadiia bacterium]